LKYNYQKSNRYFAQVADDIKDIASAELIELGADGIKDSYRGIYFNASPKVLYKINYFSRLINRVLAPLISFDCHSDNYLYQTAGKVDWSDFLNPDQTFAVFASVSNSKIKHSKFASLRLKDAIVDYFMENESRRPSIDTREPDVWFNLHIDKNEAVISLDTSGGSLHRRGYRQSSIEAPMIETLAAAIIKYSEWNGETPFYDPFCGSGTFLCEAYIHAANMPASLFRKNFGFQHLPDYDSKLWAKVKADTILDVKEVPENLISGSDISSKSVEIALKNCSNLDREKVIKVNQTNIFKMDGLKNKTIVCNPPYGVRLNKKEDLSPFYKTFGDFLKFQCKGSTAYVYFGDRKYLKNIGLRPTWKKILSNGGLDGRLAKFELY
jgi:putative N6-adenine-specific DNA methylase